MDFFIMKKSNVSFSFIIILLSTLFFQGAVKAQAEVDADAQIPEYTIGAEDILNIFVWKEEDLSRRVIVRPDGKISFPLVSDIVADGLSCRELAEKIRGKLLAYIKEPDVTVIVEEINSFKIYVLGEVNRQGVYLLKTPARLLQVLAMAGGLNEFASKSGLLVIRKGANREIRIKVDYRKIISGEKPDDNIYIKPGDTIVVH